MPENTRLKSLIASLLPGIFLIGYNIGTGSITSMSKSGANFGMDLLWAVLLSCLVTYYLINLFSKYTMVTGETVIQGMKKHISPDMVIILMVALSMIILAALMGVVGIIADVLHVWSSTRLNMEIAPPFFAILTSFLVYILLYLGNYSIFEKALALLVAIGDWLLTSLNFAGIDFIASPACHIPRSSRAVNRQTIFLPS